MKLRNAEHAIIARDKLARYLLDLRHRRGSSKAKLLHSLGYTAKRWQQLAADIRQQHLKADVVEQRETAWGKRYDIVAPLTGPSGDTIMFRSVWQIGLDSHLPRLITMYPSNQMPNLELYTDAILTVDLPNDGLRAGDVGTVVERHEVPGVPEVGYSVEFFDMTGRTVAVVTVPASSLRAPCSTDLPAVRTVAKSG